jgi:glycosyltransferase involved in cell wall biosynthesis
MTGVDPGRKGKPRISVALCTHNGARFLDAQLESLAAQSLSPDELVVSDDASSDETMATLRAFAARAPYAVRIESNPVALGVTANFALAFSRCTGDFILPCDQDDAWHPNKIARLTDALISTGADLALCDLQLVDENGRATGRTQWQALGFGPQLRDVFSRDSWDLLLRFNVATGAAMAFASRCLSTALPIPTDFIHDEWIALLASVSRPIVLVEQPLVQYRQHSNQQIGGGVQGLRKQLAHARNRMNRDYFVRQVHKTEALLQRLTEQNVPPARLDRLHARLAHLQRRVQLRDAGAHRPLAVAAEWLEGNYQRFGYGWKSAAQDLFL